MPKNLISRAPLPPGKMGPPVLGETLAALKNGFAFVEEGARRHGPIFTSFSRSFWSNSAAPTT